MSFMKKPLMVQDFLETSWWLLAVSLITFVRTSRRWTWFLHSLVVFKYDEKLGESTTWMRVMVMARRKRCERLIMVSETSRRSAQRTGSIQYDVMMTCPSQQTTNRYREESLNKQQNYPNYFHLTNNQYLWREALNNRLFIHCEFYTVTGPYRSNSHNNITIKTDWRKIYINLVLLDELTLYFLRRQKAI